MGPDGKRNFIDFLFSEQIRDASEKDIQEIELATHTHEYVDPHSDPEHQFKQLKALVARKPTKALVITFTPELARLILDRFTRVNRTIRRADVAHWAKKMKNGEWTLNGDTVKFLHNGDLGTGQHRFLACIKAGVPFTTYVAFVESIKGEGQGISQSRSDIFKEHGVRYPREVSKTVVHMIRGGGNSRPPYDPDAEYAFYKKNINGEKLEEALTACKLISKKTKDFIPEEVMYATFYALLLKDSVKAWQLIGQIKNNTKSGKVLLKRIEEIRAFIPGGESGKTYLSALIVQAHNANKQGIRLSATQGRNMLDWDRNSDFPTIL
jgi:hypothetical protein